MPPVDSHNCSHNEFHAWLLHHSRMSFCSSKYPRPPQQRMPSSTHDRSGFFQCECARESPWNLAKMQALVQQVWVGLDVHFSCSKTTLSSKGLGLFRYFYVLFNPQENLSLPADTSSQLHHLTYSLAATLVSFQALVLAPSLLSTFSDETHLLCPTQTVSFGFHLTLQRFYQVHL